LVTTLPCGGLKGLCLVLGYYKNSAQTTFNHETHKTHENRQEKYKKMVQKKSISIPDCHDISQFHNNIYKTSNIP